MSLRVAFQMDPLESIGIAGDSTFALMLSAQARGYKSWHYRADQLTYESGRVRAEARPVPRTTELLLDCEKLLEECPGRE